MKFQRGDWVEPNERLKKFLARKSIGKFNRAMVIDCGNGWVDVIFSDEMNKRILDPESFEIYLNGVDRMIQCLK